MVLKYILKDFKRWIYPQLLQILKLVIKESSPNPKPVELMEYLIKTYKRKRNDFTMGSGSTGVACVNTNRKFIGIEQDINILR
jgi:site-specific DNA-methyltransferase (adenine-specific)